MAVDVERADNEAFADLFRAAPAGLGIELLELGEVKCGAVRTLSGSRMFNRVMGLRDEALLGEVAAFYGETRFVVADAHGLGGRLEARGFTRDYGWAKFVRDLEPVAARTELRAERIGPEHAAEFGRVVAVAYGLPDVVAAWAGAIVGRPGWSCFVAFDGDEPAAAGALYLHERVGWLGFGATRQEFRGRGGQSALLAARVRRAAELGGEAVVTETGELEEGRPSNSYRNILRSGFHEVYVRPNFLSPG